MRVFMFGGSGLVGSAIMRSLADAGYELIGLARSETSAKNISNAGGIPVRGDAAEPASWLSHMSKADAVIQASADFSGDPAATEEAIVETLLDERERLGSKRIVYTGGCWLYPERTDPAISERDRFDPLPAFDYMVRNRWRLLSTGYDMVMVHPGIVWREDKGLLYDYAESIKNYETIECVGSVSTLWPMVHADDLAQLYPLALEKGASGEDYLGVADPGIPVEATIQRAETLAGRPAKVAVLSTCEAKAKYGGWVVGQARSQRILTKKAVNELGWVPQRYFATAD